MLQEEDEKKIIAKQILFTSSSYSPCLDPPHKWIQEQELKRRSNVCPFQSR